MSNAISERVANFLKEYEPFNYLSFDDLIKIANTIRVINLEKHKSFMLVISLVYVRFLLKIIIK